MSPIKVTNSQLSIVVETDTTLSSAPDPGKSFLIQVYCIIFTILNGSMEKQLSGILFARNVKPRKTKEMSFLFLQFDRQCRFMRLDFYNGFGNGF